MVTELIRSRGKTRTQASLCVSFLHVLLSHKKPNLEILHSLFVYLFTGYLLSPYYVSGASLCQLFSARSDVAPLGTFFNVWSLADGVGVGVLLASRGQSQGCC